MPNPYDDEPLVDSQLAGACPTCGQPIADPLGEIELAK